VAVIGVVKVGGGAPGLVSAVGSLHSRGAGAVVVHGAGPRISERCLAAGITPAFVDGQRVTTPAVLAIVESALAEERAALVAGLEDAGIAACGMADALDGEPAGDPRLGLVGRVVGVDGIGIRAALAGGAVPVVSPMAGGLNVNADLAASTVAASLGAHELAFLSDVPGVLDPDGRVIPEIAAADLPRLIGDGHVTGGMIPKLLAGAEALAQGVWHVRIGADTMVTA
jgi:acetylglutamate kinase